jgi:hypothetical protein
MRAIRRWARITVISTLATAAVWLLAPDAPAQAGVWELGRAQAVAGKAWGYPCSGRPEFRYSDEYAGNPDAQHAYEFDAWVMFKPPTYEPECIIWLAPGMRTASWPRLCTVILHEFGHLAGQYEHTSDPRSIMHADPAIDSRCAKRGRPYLGLPEPRVRHQTLHLTIPQRWRSMYP